MAFGRELQDFVQAFGAGMQMFPSKSEREEKKARTGVLTEQRRALEYENEPATRQRKAAQEEAATGETKARTEGLTEETRVSKMKNTPERLKLEEEKTRSDIGYQGALGEEAQERTRVSRMKTTPERLKLEEEATKAATEGTKATTGETRERAAGIHEDTREKKYKNDARQRAYDEVFGPSAPEGAVPEAESPAEDAAEPGEEAPKPQSALDVEPTVQQASYTPNVSGGAEGAVPAEPIAQGTTRRPRVQLTDSQKQAVNDAATELGINPNMLLAVISYETGGKFDPNIQGGTGGNYRGLIQFGPNERQAYGYQDGMSFEDQVRGPVVAYLKDRGLPENATLGQLYSVINAGSLKNGEPRWGASDGNDTVAGHVDTIMRQHLPVAEAMLGYQGDVYAGIPSTQTPEEVMAGGVTSQGNETDRTGEGQRPTIAYGPEAVRSGLDNLYQTAGLYIGAVPDDADRPRRMREVLKGAGSEDPQVIAEAKKIAFPKEDTRSEAEKNYEFLAKMYQYYTLAEPENPQAAKNVASSILQYYRKAAGQYAAFSQAAAQGGDMDRAVKDMVTAYAHVPDGRDLQVKKTKDGHYAVNVTDIESGKQISKQVLTPDEMFGKIMEVNPAQFETYIMQAAGEKQEGPSKAYSAALGDLPNARQYYPGMSTAEVGSVEDVLKNQAGERAGVKPAERSEMNEQIAAAADTWTQAQSPEIQEQFAPLMRTVVTPAVSAIVEQGQVTADEAFETVANILTVDPANPTTPSFNAVRQPGTDMVSVQVAGRPRPVEMPMQVFNSLIAQRIGEQTGLATSAAKEFQYQQRQGALDEAGTLRQAPFARREAGTAGQEAPVGMVTLDRLRAIPELARQLDRGTAVPAMPPGRAPETIPEGLGRTARVIPGQLMDAIQRIWEGAGTSQEIQNVKRALRLD